MAISVGVGGGEIVAQEVENGGGTKMGNVGQEERLFGRRLQGEQTNHIGRGDHSSLKGYLEAGNNIEEEEREKESGERSTESGGKEPIYKKDEENGQNIGGEDGGRGAVDAGKIKVISTTALTRNKPQIPPTSR